MNNWEEIACALSYDLGVARAAATVTDKFIIEAVQQIREMAEAHAESKGQYPQTAMGYIVARCDAILGLHDDAA